MTRMIHWQLECHGRPSAAGAAAPPRRGAPAPALADRHGAPGGRLSLAAESPVGAGRVPPGRAAAAAGPSARPRLSHRHGECQAGLRRPRPRPGPVCSGSGRAQPSELGLVKRRQCVAPVSLTNGHNYLLSDKPGKMPKRVR
jgi:hypothetical protein